MGRYGEEIRSRNTEASLLSSFLFDRSLYRNELVNHESYTEVEAISVAAQFARKDGRFRFAQKIVTWLALLLQSVKKFTMNL